MLGTDRLAIRIQAVEDDDLACRIDNRHQVECLRQMRREKQPAACSLQRLNDWHRPQTISVGFHDRAARRRSEEHTSELQSLMRTSYAVFCLKNKKKTNNQ